MPAMTLERPLDIGNVALRCHQGQVAASLRRPRGCRLARPAHRQLSASSRCPAAGRRGGRRGRHCLSCCKAATCWWWTARSAKAPPSRVLAAAFRLPQAAAVSAPRTRSCKPTAAPCSPPPPAQGCMVLSLGPAALAAPFERALDKGSDQLAHALGWLADAQLATVRLAGIENQAQGYASVLLSVAFLPGVYAATAVSEEVRSPLWAVRCKLGWEGGREALHRRHTVPVWGLHGQHCFGVSGCSVHCSAQRGKEKASGRRRLQLGHSSAPHLAHPPLRAQRGSRSNMQPGLCAAPAFLACRRRPAWLWCCSPS